MMEQTVVLHPAIDQYVRKAWAILIDRGYDTNYSTTLNLLSFTDALEGSKEGGLSEETIKALRDALGNQDVLHGADVARSLARLRAVWG